jgi:hypothetical protein
MDPIIGAGILGGAGLLSNLLQAGAQREAMNRQMAATGAQGVFQMEQARIEAEQKAKQGALADLIAAYRSTLGGGK